MFLLSFIIRITSLVFLPKIQKDYTKPEEEPLKRLAWRVLVVQPAKSVYHATGHIYDVKWIFRKLRELPSKIYIFFLYKFRLYKADKI